MRAYNPEYLYLTTSGHKTGRSHEIEIWFVPYEGRYYLISERRERSHWVQNILHNPRVSFHVEGSTSSGTGRVVESTVEPALASAVRALMNAKYNWSDGLIVELTRDSL